MSANKENGGRPHSEHELDELYAIPDFMEALLVRQTLHHRDLRYRSFAELIREGRALVARLSVDPDPMPWLWERLDAILRAVRRAR